MGERLNRKETFLIGSLLFGLFFGAGNLIFPVLLGQLAGSNMPQATFGFLLTGVGLPIMGVMASSLSESESLYEMARPVHPLYSLFFTCALYLTIGPLFAIPRTATVAFEVGLSPFVPTEWIGTGLFLFSFIFFALTLYFSLKPGRILDWVGKYLTPTFVFLLAILLIAAVVYPMGRIGNVAPEGDYTSQPLLTGFLEGYHTMDALASLAFSILIIKNIKDLGIKSSTRITIETGKAGMVSIVTMAAIYSLLAYLGTTSLGSVDRAANGGIILSMVSHHYFGLVGQILLAAIVFLACLKTAIGLITACASMFSEMFPRSISYRSYAIVFTLFSFTIANFGLNNIIQYSVPILMFLYPLAIILIVLGLLHPVIKKQKDVYRWSTGLIFLAAIFDFFQALPETLQENAFVHEMLSFAQKYLPGFELGFGWVVPGCVGLVIGFIFWKVRSKNHHQPSR